MNKLLLTSPHAKVPPIALGVATCVLGTMGNLLCFLPILGIPLAVCGFLLGLAGCCLTSSGEPTRLRWSIVGVVVASVALVNGFALAYAPLGYEPSNAVQPLWQTPPDRPYVPPPAMPGRVYKHVTKRADKAS